MYVDSECFSLNIVGLSEINLFAWGMGGGLMPMFDIYFLHQLVTVHVQ